MFTIIKKEIEWGGSKLVLETGYLARQANGAVLAKYGDTVILATVVADKNAKEDVDFFPLTVHYREMAFAAGKIPGGFFKREGKASEKEVLTSRLIDRPIRPLFSENFKNETQVLCTLLSYDNQHDSDVLSIIAASAALAISGIPFNGPVAAARVGYKDGEYILHPKFENGLFEGQLDLVVAGTETSVLMVESEARELSEEVMLGAVKFGHTQMQTVIEMIKDFKEAAGKEEWALITHDYSDLDANIKTIAEKDLKEAYSIKAKQERYGKIADIKKSVVEKLAEEYNEVKIKERIKKLEEEIVRTKILETSTRIDGRTPTEIRPIHVLNGLFPKPHGSAVFTRGETQALAVVTLGTSYDEQILDSVEGEQKEAFLVHYNFPSYSVGEVYPLRAPGRREIGHGKLAWRGLKAIIPSKEAFPYTIRIVSEITESNGSSSMATVCAASLSMMDAGVPIKSAVAGIAMGLILEGDKFAVLSDIMGDEDHLGDMDFKVAGTATGVTALQMDIKINGITIEIMETALHQAKEGRAHILEKMNAVLSAPKKELSKYAPLITTMKIDPDKIREVIGSGGKVIKGICEQTGAKVDIDNDGTISIASVGQEGAAKAIKMIEEIVSDVEINKIYDGKVVKVAEFGAFVNFLGSKDGLVHISELSNTKVENIHEFIKEGDVVKVKVLDIERGGKVKLSMRAVDQATGEDTGMVYTPRPERPKFDRDNNRGPRSGGSNKGGSNYPPNGNRSNSPRESRDNRDAPRSDRGGDRDRGNSEERRKYYS